MNNASISCSNASSSASDAGPVLDLEKEISGILGVKHLANFGYARNGLFLLLQALEAEPGAEIIIPAFTCKAIPDVIRAAGWIPVAVDSEPDGINIGPKEIEAAITPRTKAVYVVHTYGYAALIDEIARLAERRGLYLIEDVAHALFYKYQGRYLGTFGDFVVVSYTKQFAVGEGAAIGTNHDAIYERMMALRKKCALPGPRSKNFAYRFFRYIGSLWDAHASFFAWMILKTADTLASFFSHSDYDEKIEEDCFYLRPEAASSILKQLPELLKRRESSDGKDYERFKKKFAEKISILSPHQKKSDTMPHYHGGRVRPGSRLRWISFRTWKNYHEPKKFPVSDKLFAEYHNFPKVL